jgi:uncharacterized protein (UPF0212 family)
MSKDRIKELEAQLQQAQAAMVELDIQLKVLQQQRNEAMDRAAKATADASRFSAQLQGMAELAAKAEEEAEKPKPRGRGRGKPANAG